jgi:hypothetical protein
MQIIRSAYGSYQTEKLQKQKAEMGSEFTLPCPSDLGGPQTVRFGHMIGTSPDLDAVLRQEEEAGL